MNRLRYMVLCGLTGLMMLSGGGCSVLVNAHRQKEPMMNAYLAGRQDEAMAFLEEKLEEPHWYNASAVGSGDEVMWRLEAGSLTFLAGQDTQSIDHFRRAEELIADFDTRAVVNLREIGAESAVLVTNPNALPYRGFCRDRVLLPVFKALAYLGREDEEGFRVELFRLRENQDRVMTDYRDFFQKEEQAVAAASRKNTMAAAGVNSGKILADSRNRALAELVKETGEVAHRGYAEFLNPLAIFLSGYGYARDGDYQNAVVDFERLYRALPENPLARQYYATALHLAGHAVPEELKAVKLLDYRIGRGTVLVIFANGRGPAFRPFSLYIPVVFPGYATIAAVSWPVCEYYQSPYRTLRITAGKEEYETVTIADMDGILAREYTERLPGMITRIALSTAVKEVGSYFATRAAAESDSLAGAATAIGLAAYKVAVNTADTRTWEALPREFQVAQFPMPADRKLVLKPDGGASVTVDLPPDARSAIVYVNAPSRTATALTYRVFGLKSQ